MNSHATLLILYSKFPAQIARRDACFLTKSNLNISNSTKSKFPAKIVHIIFEMVPMISRLFSCKTAIYRPFHVLSRKLHEEAINVRWEKPEIGWTKLNFDGSCRYKTGEASIGGIFRNHNAEFLLGYAEFIGQSNSTIAELVAMRKGLDHVLQNRWDYVLIEGDSKGIIDVISRKREAKCKEMQMHVRCIRLMLGEIKNYVLSHVFREGNMAADRFAQMGQQLLKPQIWHEPPNEVLDIVKDDAIGKIYYRLK